MAGQRFSVPYQTTASAAGAGSVSHSPAGSVDQVVTLTSVSAATNVKEATAGIYINGTAASNWVEGTQSASTGDSTDTRHVLHAGDTLTCIWSGADAGTTLYLRVTGVQYPSGQAPPE